MHPEIDRIIVTAEQLAQRNAELGRQITADYAGKPLTVVSILRGSIIFVADLIRHIELDLELDFIGAASYGDDTETSGHVDIRKHLDGKVHDRHVLLVDDILDTGYTIKTVCELIRISHPLSLKTAVAFDKPARRKVALEADYVGFTIDPVFIVGYGLDLAQKYRNLPYIGVPKKEVLDRTFGTRP
ncbi:MAG TPA: hypoxanthine phosphoribosyltransferase [bacterium]|mgnify:CR=1 FL=1|nr:hypoxanthine phosphoribosyltransferase [bacterium]